VGVRGSEGREWEWQANGNLVGCGKERSRIEEDVMYWTVLQKLRCIDPRSRKIG